MYMIVCAPQTAIPDAASVIRTCSDCETKVWVGREFAPMVDAGEGRPVCPDCALILIEKHPEMKAQVHSAQADRLNRLGLLGLADQLVTAFNRRDRGNDGQA